MIWNRRDGLVASALTLIGQGIEGEWNIPLLRNAAEMSGASLLFAQEENSACKPDGPDGSRPQIERMWQRFDHVVACEAIPAGRNVYEYPAPRGRLGVIVGNELSGIPRQMLRKADQVVAIPMFGRGISSVNVAVAAAVVLYALQRDLGRKRLRTSALAHRDVDVLVLGPSDPNELGSLFRSVWAFGWQRVFLADPQGAWFSKDRSTVIAGRAAARREVNPLVIAPHDQLDVREYERIVRCSSERQGTALSRYSLTSRGKTLLVYGDGELPFEFTGPVDSVYVDYAAAEVPACFRHAGSILLSVVSQLLWRGRHG